MLINSQHFLGGNIMKGMKCKTCGAPATRALVPFAVCDSCHLEMEADDKICRKECIIYTKCVELEGYLLPGCILKGDGSGIYPDFLE